MSAGAIAVHALGGIGLIAGNANRLKRQDEAKANTGLKATLTVLAAGLTAYSGVLGKKVYENRDQPTEGTTEPSSTTDSELASAQRQLGYCQWAIPVITGVLLALGAQQGEQQRPTEQAKGVLGLRVPAKLNAA